MSISAYRLVGRAAGPIVRHFLDRRLARGREDAARMGERIGRASAMRPEGPLVWLHAASVGEAAALLSVIERLRKERTGHVLLITTGTVTSARLLAERLPKGVIHQYIPVDREPWICSFLDHWQPHLVLWMESELWPIMLSEISGRRIPAILINGRLSERSWRRWRRFRWISRRLLGTFDHCMAQTEADARRLRDLGARSVSIPGNLKYAATPLPASPDALVSLQSSIMSRPRWLAFSTHPGEEEILARVHASLSASVKGVLTIIAPRHPSRGSEIADMLRARGLKIASWKAREKVDSDTDVLLVDTIGELGLFFRVTDVSLVGGSLVPHGGQNPIEAAMLGCAILHGPHMQNFYEIRDEMHRAGATVSVATVAETCREVEALLTDAELRGARIEAAQTVVESRRGILDEVFARLDGYLDQICVDERRVQGDHESA